MSMNTFILILLYAIPLLATIAAFYGFISFLQGKRRKELGVSESLRKRNIRILVESKKLEEDNKDLGEEVLRIQNLYEIIRGMSAALEFESTFQIFSKKLREMFSFGRAELILLEKKGGKMGIKRVLEIVGTETPDLAGRESSSLKNSLVDLFMNGRGEAIFISDTRQSLRTGGISLPKGVESFAAIPLMMEKKILAVMTMENMRKEKTILTTFPSWRLNWLWR